MAGSVRAKDRPCGTCGIAQKHYYTVMGRRLCRSCLQIETNQVVKKRRKISV